MKKWLLTVFAGLGCVAAAAQSTEEADSVCRRMVLEGNARAIARVGAIEEQLAKGDSTNLFALPMHQLSLGLGYANGLGDYEEGAKWFEKAACFTHFEPGDEVGEYVSLAQCNLAVCYDQGWGVEQSDSTALYWYSRAAEAGNNEARCALAQFYSEGMGVRRDRARAFRLVEAAAGAAYIPAYGELGMYYENGWGTKRNCAEAVACYRKGAEGGDEAAMFELGRMYYYGRGVERNYDEAFRWFSAADDAGYVYALPGLAECYRLGRGVRQDEQRAIDYLTRAVAMHLPGGVEKELARLLRKNRR